MQHAFAVSRMALASETQDERICSKAHYACLWALCHAFNTQLRILVYGKVY